VLSWIHPASEVCLRYVPFLKRHGRKCNKIAVYGEANSLPGVSAKTMACCFQIQIEVSLASLSRKPVYGGATWISRPGNAPKVLESAYPGRNSGAGKWTSNGDDKVERHA